MATLINDFFVSFPPQVCRPLSTRFGFEFSDPVGADLMDDATEFLDALAEPGQFLFADPVMF